MNHPYTQQMLVSSRQRDLQAEARMVRLAREARDARTRNAAAPSVSPVRSARIRVGAGIAALLVTLGLVAGAAAAPAPEDPSGGGSGRSRLMSAVRNVS